jgi:uncharacterized protein (TIGR01777 family)
MTDTALSEPPAANAAGSGRTVLITGATGFIGRHLVRRLLARGDTLIVLTRSPARARKLLGTQVQTVAELGALSPSTPIDAIVNLAGARILGQPWTHARRAVLLRSRIGTTNALIALGERLERRPRVLVSASAIGNYGIRGDEPLDEQAAPQPIFQSMLCQQWEQAAAAAERLGIRSVALRFGLVLGRDGGALPALARPVSMGLGAVIGTGRQWLSWIHIDDAVRLIEFCLDSPALRGAVNAVAPEAVTHRTFQQQLAATLHRPLWLRIPGPLLRLTLGEMAQLLVDGQRVVPARASAAGFQFGYHGLAAALQHLIGPHRAADERQS